MMKYIKNYKEFDFILESRRAEVDLFSSKIELYHCGDHIWVIKSPDAYTRALMFMRPQEYYESAFEEIIKKQFKVSRFVDIYKQHYGNQIFTYGDDWAGFNIPSTILEECMFNIPDDEINNWDRLMLSVIDTIRETEKDHVYYLLGVDELSNHLLEHEFAHAMYFTLPDYKLEMDTLTENCEPQIKHKMYKCITDYGYADHVLQDELQAYMATGLGQMMEKEQIPNIEIWMEKYRQVFEKFYSKTLYSSPIKVELAWS